MRIRTLAVSALTISVALSSTALAQRGGGGPASTQPVEPLRFRYMGPISQGRVAAVAGIPGDTMTYYFGAASGGVWKTTDGGATYAPMFDDQPVQAIGALAVAPSDKNIVWAGTGEAWVIRDADVMGDGVYKSTDGGNTWTNMGLRETGRIGRILVNPANPDIVFVCAIGRVTGKQQERGVFRTTDGGKSWTRSLFVNDNTGCSGISMDAHDPNVLFAGTWEVSMKTWQMLSGGPGSGVYVTRNGGDTWTRLANGLPSSPVGKIDVAVAPSDSKRVYALIQTANQGSVWRSDDGGEQWRVVSWDRTLIGRAGYYIRIMVNAKNADEVLIANSTFKRSTDGGVTWPINGGGCGDCHDIWVDPLNGDHWVVSGDNTQGITRNHGRTFTNVNLPIGQMYHVAVDERVPYWIYSNRQDNGTMRGPSDSPMPVPTVPSYYQATGVGHGPMRGTGGRGGRGGGGGDDAPAPTGGRGANADSARSDSSARRPDSTATAPQRGGGGRGGPAPLQATPNTPWETSIGGCESGFTIPEPKNPDIVWATCYGNEVTRYDSRLKLARAVGPGIHTLDSPPNRIPYRCHWTPPLAIDPFDPKTVYYGCQVIFKTSNAGQSWTVISPDLSTRDSSIIVSSGGIVEDNLGQFYGALVFAIAPSEVQRGLIWAGTNDGKLWNTRDGGVTWVDVTKNVTGLPKRSTIRQISPSRIDPGTAYVSVDAHMIDNSEPYIFKTADYGRTWTSVTGDLPRSHPLAYVMSVTENPNRKGMLFAGTGNAFYYSYDDGAHWTQFKNGLPASPVTWITVQKDAHDVVISTYGRGLFILPDITRLEQPDQTPTAGAVLYKPRPAFREARSGSANFLFDLSTAPAGPVTVEILDSSRTIVRRMQLNARAGANRATWDLRFESPEQIALRTLPPDNPHIWEEARYKGRNTRPIVHWGIQNPQRGGAIAAPGRYTVRLLANGATLSQPFAVMKDPDIPTTTADISASTRMQQRIVTDMNTTVDMANRLEVMRKQIEDLVRADSTAADAKAALRDLDAKMFATELRLLSKTDLHSDDKWYVEQYKIYMNLIWLSGQVGLGAGDVQGGAEYRPTDASLAVLNGIERDLRIAKAEFDRLIATDVPAFNQKFAGRLAKITDGTAAAIRP